MWCSSCFTPGKEFRYPLNRRMKGTDSPSGHFGEEKHFLPPPRFKPQTVQSVVKLLYRPCYPGKTKCVVLHAAKAFWWSSGVAALTVNHGKRWMWISVSHPGDFTSKERDPDIHSLGGWMGVRASLDVWKKRKISCCCQELNHDSSKTPHVLSAEHKLHGYSFGLCPLLLFLKLPIMCYVIVKRLWTWFITAKVWRQSAYEILA
jgi:hypothetical protein